ncbi:double-strand break repair protein AddB [Pseudodonghicola flavimaris]|uniref:Double-strand break repair protein AddB n=1 Tax=Pseudodonghicola flavimaris TaxID=3050036 RepID=A0ABT7EZP8_9RHOB|nr:double-strand break repair protein AddB [Pseudodonghicola flavimaris]MDK3017836.1 double-strand break repair protein AddB [Pseudodonghicola flavimaris]
MFDPDDTPRVFALPCGVDFPRALIDGLLARMAGQPPEALARVELVVNTRRMARRIRDIFDAGPPRLLPRVSLLTDLGESAALDRLPPAIPPLRRRLELTQLISALLDKQPDLAARASLYDLADSLAGLIDEMQGEGVSPEDIRTLDVSDLSGHWARAQTFIGIAEDMVGSEDGALDPQARQRRVVEDLIARWQVAPPDHPVILAGSTGSRGTTMMLMQAVAHLPQGALVLPGYDFDQPAAVWASLERALTSEDHPQYRFRKLLDVLDMAPDQVGRWTGEDPPAPARNRLISLALRPAPVTDAWMAEGPGLTDLDRATADLTLVEAPSPREEALAIALRLRQAAETGQSAALITPDRMLTRQVTAALERWDIIPDDSAGQPLHLSPPGRFLRHVADLFCQRLTGETLLTLLKHPLTHTGIDRGDHLRFTRDLELDLRKHGPAFPDAAGFAQFASRHDPEAMAGWIAWLSDTFCDRPRSGPRPLADWVADLRALAESIAAGPTADSGELWQKNAGIKALSVIDALDREAGHGGALGPRDFADLLTALLQGEEVRDRDAAFGGIMIWGTLEARVMGADLLILGGLNEGSWPEPASPDPWLNRQMRNRAGLLLPERRIGLSAHDFQQAIAAPEVWLTRAQRSDDAETVPSRWLNRLANLLAGLPDQGGRAALKEMRARGRVWLHWARALEAVTPVAPAPRPSPRPPVAARPDRLNVTEIKRLIRDPYAIYARRVLRLSPLDPLVQEPDALLRGTVLHEVFEKFLRDDLGAGALLSREALMARARQVLEENVPWPTARTLWLARLNRIAEAFLAAEATRQEAAVSIAFEQGSKLTISPPGVTLLGRADRIDMDTRGALTLYDYKTGSPPTRDQQAKFDKQLLIEAAMAEEVGFGTLAPAHVNGAVFVGIGASYKEVPAPLDEEPPAQVLEELRKLLIAYHQPDQGYTSRRMLFKDSDQGDYDHLARFGEWDRATEPDPEDLT